MKPQNLMAVMLSLVLFGCGGGGSSSSNTGGTGNTTLTTTQRITAATTTAESTTNACSALPAFYWEIGDQGARLAGGSVQASGGTTAFDATTSMNIASASKWLYGAYVVQKRAGTLTAQDIKYLSFQSGYVSFSTCLPGQSVSGCSNFASNDTYTPGSDGRFDYGGGHMQRHAATIEGLGAYINGSLAAEIQTQLGSDVGMSYSQPQLAGGVVSTANDYAVFLRKVLAGSLLMAGKLGTSAVCTNPSTCSTADYTPIPSTESWHYSVGHWVEDDPTVGDGAFSSPGAFGFYPWLDAGKQYYGILAREDRSTVGTSDASASAYYRSVQCGRLIRQAWLTGVAR